MYRVVVAFEDLQDGSYPYKVGDIFPREGKTVSKERLEELCTRLNRRRMVMIEKVQEPKVEEPKVEKATEEEKPKKRTTRKTKKAE